VTEVYGWAADAVDTVEVIHIEVPPGRSDLNALLFIKQVLKQCRGEPVGLVDRGPWYDWALEDLDLCESRRETWGNGLSSKRGSACSNNEPGSSIAGPPHSS
jgi:putative transposase